MSCNHCGNKFNFFHKEMGCSSCGLSFCNKCLKQKTKIPNKGKGELPVCKMCYINLSSDGDGHIVQQPVNVPPPDAYLRRLEALENPAAPPIIMYKHDVKLERLRSGLSPADQQLLDRLEKLKDDKNKVPPPTDDELRTRLNSLKGVNEYVQGPSKPVFTVDTKSDQEKVDSLLEMFMTEREIELVHNPEEGIVARLATLRGQGVRPNESAYISNLCDVDSDEEIDQISKKIMDEVALEGKCANVLPKSKVTTDSLDSAEDNGNSSPELPWCVLCNADAKYRCLDCNDLYCASCNAEVHKSWDADHRVIEYRKN